MFVGGFSRYLAKHYITLISCQIAILPNNSNNTIIGRVMDIWAGVRYRNNSYIAINKLGQSWTSLDKTC